MKYFRNTFKVLKPQSILSLEIKTIVTAFRTKIDHTRSSRLNTKYF